MSKRPKRKYRQKNGKPASHPMAELAAEFLRVKQVLQSALQSDEDLASLSESPLIDDLAHHSAATYCISFTLEEMVNKEGGSKVPLYLKVYAALIGANMALRRKEIARANEFASLVEELLTFLDEKYEEDISPQSPSTEGGSA